MSDFKSLKFSKNWNRKLDCELFTTIRKADHYVNAGDKVVIVINDKVYKWAFVEFHIICKATEIGSIILMQDTGLMYEKAIELFSTMGLNFSDPETVVKILFLRSVGKEDIPQAANQMKHIQEKISFD